MFDIILISVAIIFLIVISAFFSGSETALTAASRARMHKLEKDGDLRAGLVNRLIARREQLLGTILLGNNLVNILASALTTSLFLTLFGPAGVIYATLIMTAAVVIFAEVLPKTYAITVPERAALFVAPILKPIVFLFAPLARSVEYIVRNLLRILGVRSQAPMSGHEELRGVIDLHHKEGGVVKDDRDMLDGILDLRDLDVADVMVHRTNMQSINVDDPPQLIVDEVLKSGYTRLPLWRDKPENIVGVLHAKDLLRAMTRVKNKVEDIDILSVAIDPWFVPESTKLQDQLNAFLRRKMHFSLVVDEYGEVMGLVTLEDIIEEIVGEIVDEHDIIAAGIRPQPDGSLNVDGTVPIRDLNRFTDWELPEDEATTVAGLVIHEARSIPEPGQAFTFYGYRFEVLRRQNNRIMALRITALPGSDKFKPRPASAP